MRSIRSCLLLAILSAPSFVHAQGALLRITCEGNDAKAEVSVNGAFKGECPIDVHVQAGTVKLRVAKKAGGSERVYEEEMRLGDGVVKRIEAILSAPRMTSDGQRREEERVALERAQAAKRNEDREADLAKGVIPPRPQLPFAVSEQEWRAIEASDMYRNQPAPRKIRVHSEATSQMQYTGSKLSAMPAPAPAKQEKTIESVPLGIKCSLHKTSIKAGLAPIEIEAYHCGGIHLGSTKTPMEITAIKGSLHPIRIGALAEFRSAWSYGSGNPRKSTMTTTTEVLSKGPASALHPRLTGTAWKLRYSNVIETTDTGAIRFIGDDYYLEDLRVDLSAIGVFDFQTRSFVIPTPGSQTTFVMEGDFGSRTTYTYSAYDWSVE